MKKINTAAEPNRRPSRDNKKKASEKAREALLRRLESQPVRNIGRWTRDELYERD